MIILPGAACSEGTAVEIILFEPASGNYKPGQTAVSSIAIKNTGNTRRDFFIGYSIRDSFKSWYDLPATGPVELLPGEISGKISMKWQIPEDDPYFCGYYKVVMAVWDSMPAAGSVKYANAVKDNAFFIEEAAKQKVYEMNSNSFYPVTHHKNIPNRNRGIIRSRNIAYNDNAFSLKFFKNSFDGAQIETPDVFGIGIYKAHIKTVPGLKSVTGFFLYAPETEDEITIEIFNDNSRKVWMTSYIGGGEPKAKLTYTLDFDPAAEFHEYKIDYRYDAVTFFVDDKLIGKIENKSFKTIPINSKMKLVVNSWFPGWKELEPLGAADLPDKNYETIVKKIELLPF